MNQQLNERADHEEPTRSAQRRGRGSGGFWTPKMVKWAIISVMLALVPPLSVVLGEATRGSLPALADLIGRGELLVNTMLLCAGCALELLSKQPNSTETEKLVAAGATIFILVLAAHYYANISSHTISGIQIDRSVVSVVSLLMYGCALIAGGRCIFLSEVR